MTTVICLPSGRKIGASRAAITRSLFDSVATLDGYFVRCGRGVRIHKPNGEPDEGLYRTALEYARSSKNRRMAALGMLSELRDMGITKTPDGAPYTVTTIAHAMQGM